ncbi:MAG: flagellar export chaperone FliS [Alphaproteobacteria bacterium]
MRNAGANTYQTQEILTASPARLVVKLYEAAIAALRRSIRAIEEGDIEGRWRANRRAAEIIEHLLATLDHEKGGEIAANLDRLYLFMLRRLMKVDLDNDPKPAEDVIRLIEPLCRSWRALDRKLANESAAERPHANAASIDVPPTPDTPGYDKNNDTQRPESGARIVAIA